MTTPVGVTCWNVPAKEAAGALIVKTTAAREAPVCVHTAVEASTKVPPAGIVVPAGSTTVLTLPASTRQTAVTMTGAAPLFNRMKRFVYPAAANVENHGDCRIVAFAPHVQMLPEVAAGSAKP